MRNTHLKVELAQVAEPNKKRTSQIQIKKYIVHHIPEIETYKLSNSLYITITTSNSWSTFLTT